VHNRNYDPVTGRQSIHFTRIPLWWAAVIANGLSELVNLAALGFAPATLVAPLGCLSVVFNAFTAVFWLREPFFKRDLLGLALISAGVSCIVMGQVGSPAPPITVPYLREVVASSSFYLSLASLAAFLALLVLWAQPRFARRFAWVYLAESAVFGSATTAAARAFASLAGSRRGAASPVEAAVQEPLGDSLPQILLEVEDRLACCCPTGGR